jgi:ParB family chromosome partitioning protein
MRHDSHFVEELSGRAGVAVGRIIPIGRLEPNPNQPRTEIGDLTEMIESIKEVGVLEPLLVRPSEVGGRYMIISGERRYRASLEAGLRELPCIEMNIDDRGVAEIALIENLQRKDLTPFEVGAGIQALVEKFDYTHELVAKKLGKSRTSITEALTLLSIPTEVRELCRRADISSKTILLQIARQPDVEAMIKLIEKIGSMGLTRDQVRQARNSDEIRKPFQFKYQPENKDFKLEIKFRKDNVSRDELISAVEELLSSIRSQPE